MNGFEVLAWVVAGVIIFIVTASIIIFWIVYRENKKAFKEFKKRKNLG